MTNYISAVEIAEKWKLTPRRVQLLCKEGKIAGAKKQSGVWLIPDTSRKPERSAHISAGIKIKRVLSLFSGCGGMDLGFEGGFEALRASVNLTMHPGWEAGKSDKPDWVSLKKTEFSTVFATDIKESAKIAWCNYFKKYQISSACYYLDSIVDIVKLYQENKLNVFPGNIDVVTGGFPCQDFSVAGKRMGFDSDKSHTGIKKNSEIPSVESRGQLYIWMREVIAITQPKVFIAENVKGLINLADVKDVIEKDFRSIGNNGYIVVPVRILHAASYGIPQSRERVVFLGFKRSALNPQALNELSKDTISPLYDPYPPVTHRFKQKGTNLLPLVAVSQAFLGLREPQDSDDISQQKYSKAKYMGKHCQGQNEVNMEGLGPTIRSEHHGNIEFRRLSLEHGGKCHHELELGFKERRLSVRECARIQSFPDDYQFVIPSINGQKGVSASEAYKLIGNAVPPLLAYNIAMRLQENWELYFGGER